MSKKKIELNKNLEFIPATGDINVLLVAPHGVMGDDDDTGTLTRYMAERLGCAAVINEHYRRTRDVVEEDGSVAKEKVDEPNGIVNLNSVQETREAGLNDSYLNFIRQVRDEILEKNNGNPCYIFFIHGIDDNKIKNAAKANSQILIGIGKAAATTDDKDRWCANEYRIEKFIKLLGKLDEPITAEITTNKSYAGRRFDNLVQEFCESNYFYERIHNRHSQCIQLEIQNKGYRDETKNLKQTAKILADAIHKFTNKFNTIYDSLAKVSGVGTVGQQLLANLLKGKYANILLLAPNAHPTDDGIQIALLTQLIGKELNCPMLINEKFSLPKVCDRKKNGKYIYEKPGPRKKIADWFNIEHAEDMLEKELIEPLKSAINASGKTLVVWLHNGTNNITDNPAVGVVKDGVFAYDGVDDSVQKWEQDSGANSFSISSVINFSDSVDDIAVDLSIESWMLGEESNPITATGNTVITLFNSCNDSNLKTVLKSAPGTRHETMLFWFDKQGIPLEKVESISLRLKGSRCLDSEESIKKTAESISLALMEVADTCDEQAEDLQLVDRAFTAIIKRYNLYAAKAVKMIGGYLIEEFYRGDYDLARKGQQGVHKKKSINALFDKMSDTPGAPGKTWLYNAVKLVVVERDIEENDPKLFQTYGKLMLSHKVALLSEKSLKEKKELVAEIQKNNYSVRELMQRQKELRGDKPQTLPQLIASPGKLFDPDYKEHIEPAAIAKLSLPVLKTSHTKAVEKVASIQESITNLEQKIEEQRLLAVKYKDLIGSIEKAEEEKQDDE